MGEATKYRCNNCQVREAMDCDACVAIRRDAYFSKHPDARGRYDARVAAAAKRKAELEALRAVEVTKYRAAKEGDYFPASRRAVPHTHRAVRIELADGVTVFAVAHDVSPKSVETHLYRELSQTTDGRVVCRLVDAETDEQMATRNKEAA